MSRWYIIHAYSGFENKVRDAIMSEATAWASRRFVEQIEVPTETITEIKRGKKVQSERKFMPGYVLAKLEMNDEVYHLVKNTPKVTGFLGPSGKPQPIPDAQAARMLDTKEEAAAHGAKQKINVDYEIGDAVKVLDGPFASFNGVVEELDFDRGRVKVSVSHLRPRDAGRAGVRAGRTGEVASLPARHPGAESSSRNGPRRAAQFEPLARQRPGPRRAAASLCIGHLLRPRVVLRVDVGDLERAHAVDLDLAGSVVNTQWFMFAFIVT